MNSKKNLRFRLPSLDELLHEASWLLGLVVILISAPGAYLGVQLELTTSFTANAVVGAGLGFLGSVLLIGFVIGAEEGKRQDSES